MKLLCLLLLGLVSSGCGERRRFDGYQVWLIETELSELQERYVLSMEEEQVVDRMGNELLVGPEDLSEVHSVLRDTGIKYTIETQDLQQSLDPMWARIDGHKAYDKADFNTYDDIISEINRLAEEECPAGFTCDVYSIGQTVEERDLVVIKISQGSGRQAVWFDSLIHAREWVAGSSTMRILDQFLTGYGSDDDATYVLDNYDLYFLPVHNPDGYSYTFTNERMWRKNRSPNSGSSCVGVDNNRNHDYQWSQPGASSNPCSETYYGSGAASEHETAAVQAEVGAHAADIVALCSIHTQATAWLTPWGDCTDPPNNDDIMRVARAAVDAIEATHGTTWRIGNSCQVLYRTSGTTADWAQAQGIPYSSTPELRGPGFNPGVGAIQPAFEETWNGFIAMVRTIDAIKAEK